MGKGRIGLGQHLLAAPGTHFKTLLTCHLLELLEQTCLANPRDALEPHHAWLATHDVNEMLFERIELILAPNKLCCTHNPIPLCPLSSLPPPSNATSIVHGMAWLNIRITWRFHKDCVEISDSTDEWPGKRLYKVTCSIATLPERDFKWSNPMQ